MKINFCPNFNQKALSRFINNDLKNTCQVFGIPYNIKSHSFRINMISNLLKTTTVQNAAQIIGHNDIHSTVVAKTSNKLNIKF